MELGPHLLALSVLTFAFGCATAENRELEGRSAGAMDGGPSSAVPLRDARAAWSSDSRMSSPTTPEPPSVRACPCTKPFVCERNVCVCVAARECPATSCGNVADGCGGVLHCGACTDGSLHASDSESSTNNASTNDAGKAATCMRAECTTNACGRVPDGCGGSMDCGRCAGTLECGFSEPNRCGTGSKCSANHICGTLNVPAGAREFNVTSARVLLYRTRILEHEQVLANPIIATKLALLASAPVNDGQTEPTSRSVAVNIDVSDWNPTEGYLVFVLSDGRSGEPTQGDLIAFPKRSESIRFIQGASYGMGEMDADFFIPVADDPRTAGHSAPGVVFSGESSCPGTACEFVDQPRLCATSCPSAPIKYRCDGPQDCAAGQFCCQTTDYGQIEKVGHLTATAECKSSCKTSMTPPVFVQRRCHVDGDCEVGEFCTGIFFGLCAP